MEPGTVIWVDLTGARGKEQQGRRPAVVVSSRDHLSAVTDLVLVVPCTTRDRGWINHVPLTGPAGLEAPTFAMTEQVRAVSRSRVNSEGGAVSQECLRKIRAWVHRWLV